MARTITGTGFSVLGLAAGLASQMLSAQALGLPASDPVGIGRSGTGVAFGQSLEAAALNPALLVSLRGKVNVFLGVGIEGQASQATLISTQHTLSTTDRNRSLPSLGAAWRLNDALVFGLKLDEPYLRHGTFSDESTTRFQQQGIKLITHRLEAQAAWALNPNWSIGAGLGITRVRYTSTAALRVLLPAQLGQPVSDTNPAQALMELPMVQSAQAMATTFSLGFRWAMNPRWTIGGAYQSAIRVNPDLKAGATEEDPSYFGTDGFSTPSIGIETLGPAMLHYSRSIPGEGRIVLPARASLGVRQRFNQFVTWEVDLRYIGGKSLELPSQMGLQVPSGTIAAIPLTRQGRNGFGVSGTVELNINKKWTARAGAEFWPSLVEQADVEPMVGGARTAGFSGGVSYKGLGGEWSFGYQFRQSLDHDSPSLDGKWDQYGHQITGTPMRVEGMGHMAAIGFKKSF